MLIVTARKHMVRVKRKGTTSQTQGERRKGIWLNIPTLKMPLHLPSLGPSLLLISCVPTATYTKVSTLTISQLNAFKAEQQKHLLPLSHPNPL
jgi:hypothetical protein